MARAHRAPGDLLERQALRRSEGLPAVRRGGLGRRLAVGLRGDRHHPRIDAVEAEGPGAGTLGRVFGAIYARNLDRARVYAEQVMEDLRGKPMPNPLGVPYPASFVTQDGVLAMGLAAAVILVREGFTVLPYINADPVLAKRLQDAGTATVMPLGSPIGSNRGIETRAQIEIIIEQATVPVVVDAGLGAPSQAAEAMEMGADAVLVNTAIAIASDPSRMAHAFRKAVEAGREAREIGLAETRSIASASSPLTGFFSAGEL